METGRGGATAIDDEGTEFSAACRVDVYHPPSKGGTLIFLGGEPDAMAYPCRLEVAHGGNFKIQACAHASTNVVEIEVPECNQPGSYR